MKRGSREKDEMSTDNETGAAEQVVNVVQSAADRLRADLNKVRPMPEGTLLRFKSVSGQTGVHFSYGAIFAGGQWHLTTQGNNHFPARASHIELMNLLVSRGHAIMDLEVANGFDKIEL